MRREAPDVPVIPLEASDSPEAASQGRTVSPDLVFGARARALEARARGRAYVPAYGDGDEVDLVFRSHALAAERPPLLAGPPSARRIAAGWTNLRCRAAELREAAEQGSPDAACLWAAHGNARAKPGRPRLMGIVNVTPDSFSDGGLFLDPRRAVEHGLRLVEDGAELLDVGGESTRPGSAGVEAAEECRRVLPVIEGLAARTAVPLSIDTTKAEVARAALEAGASVVNDVSAGRFDPALLELVAERGCEIVLMHMRGRPRNMQVAPNYGDVVAEVTAHLRARTAACLKTGIALSKIVLDPGIGFGKRLEDNLELIRGLPALRSLGRPILLGVSRKSFLGRLSGRETAPERLEDTVAAVTAGILFGAEILRVHDVRSMSPALRVAAALATARDAPSFRPDSP